MKKILHKLKIKKQHDESSHPSRITSDTVAEHREKILAGGRRFKYPIQYTRHKLVINAILISIAAVIITITVGWWQLYVAQNNSDFMYRVTRFIPVPVANVDGQPVLYSDYLMTLRSSIYFSEQNQQLNSKTSDGKRQIDYFKQQSMKESITDAYALKLAGKLNVSVSESELDSFIKTQRQTNNGEISQQSYDTATQSLLGLSPSENRYYLKKGILRRKVAYKMDDQALGLVKTAKASIKSNPTISFTDLAAKLSTKEGVKVTYGTSGKVPINNWDGGLSAAASKLKKLESSSEIKSTKGDGYYIVRLIEASDDNISYEYINIPLTAFTKSLDSITAKGKVQKYISLTKVSS